jgi:hypothetical protein
MTGNGFLIGDQADALVERADGTIDMTGIRLDLGALTPTRLAVGGYFVVSCYDQDGNLKWEDTAENGVSNNALNDILNVYLRGTSQTANFYLGLVDNASFTGFAAGDTMSSHSGWAESTAFTNANRVQWSPAGASSQAVSNTTTCDFNMNVTATICRSAVRLGPILLDRAGAIERVAPIAAEELTDGQEPLGLGTGLEFLATPGVPQGRLEAAGLEVAQGGPAVLRRGGQRRAEQPEVALAPPARVGPGLLGAAGRALQARPRAGDPRVSEGHDRSFGSSILEIEDQVLDLAHRGPDGILVVEGDRGAEVGEHGP